MGRTSNPLSHAFLRYPSDIGKTLFAAYPHLKRFIEEHTRVSEDPELWGNETRPTINIESPFKEGSQVWSATHGEGEVVYVHHGFGKLIVCFPYSPVKFAIYGLNGKEFRHSPVPTLFPYKPDESSWPSLKPPAPESPKHPDLKVDDLVEVWDGTWKKAHFKGWSMYGKSILVWRNGRTSHTATHPHPITAFLKWRLPKTH